MRTFVILITILLTSITGTVYGQTIKTEKFKVYGNCSMCKERIEKAAYSVEGVDSANWNVKTKTISVTYDASKTDIHKVHMAIAKAGHDTDMHKAGNEAYSKLPQCCRYERSAE